MNKIPELNITGDTLDEALQDLHSNLLHKLALASASENTTKLISDLQEVNSKISNNTVLLQAFYQAMILGPELLAEAKFKSLTEEAYGVHNEVYEDSATKTDATRFIRPLDAFKGANMKFEEGYYNAFFGSNQVEFSSEVSVYGMTISVFFYHQKKLSSSATKIDNVKFLFSADGKPVGNLFNKGYFVNLDNGDKNVVEVVIKDITTIKALKKAYYDRVDKFFEEKLATDIIVKGLRELRNFKIEIDSLHQKRYRKDNLNNKELIELYNSKVDEYMKQRNKWAQDRNKVIKK